MSDPIIELRAVMKRYGTGPTAVTALDETTLSIERGQRVSVTGASGSGKTTLLSILGLVETPDAGSVLVDGHDVGRQSADELAASRRRYIGFVFQLFHLVPSLTALDNVCLPLMPYVDGRALVDKAKRLLEQVGLEDRANHRPHQMSGGEQQRVAICRALIGDPAVVLADEPTGNLDSLNSQAVIDLMLNFQTAYDFAIVIATHDEQIASRFAERIQLRDGRVVPSPGG